MSILGRVPKILPAIRRPHTPCTECGGAIEQRVGESNTRFWGRQTCSQICGQRARFGTTEKLVAAQGRICKCGTPMIQREDEDTYTYIRRKTCGDPKCIAGSKIPKPIDRPNQRSMRPASAMRIGDDLLNYGQGFTDMDPEPGDGGKLRVSRPANGLALSVAGRYL